MLSVLCMFTCFSLYIIFAHGFQFGKENPFNLLFEDFSSIVVYEVKSFFFPKMEAMGKNHVKAQTCEHAQNREYGNALTRLDKVEELINATSNRFWPHFVV